MSDDFNPAPVLPPPPAPLAEPLPPLPAELVFNPPPLSTTPPPSAYGKVTVDEGFNQRALVKLVFFLLIIFSLGILSTVTITRLVTTQVYRATKGVLLSAPFKTTVWQSFGSVPEAELELPLQTPYGIVNHSFLLDTGAVVSSLPREMADKLGFNLAFLPRQTFKGFGNTTSFAYTAEMNVSLGEKIIELPVVFTEAAGSKSLLGRKGLFDKFTIIMDHKNRIVEIRE